MCKIHFIFGGNIYVLSKFSCVRSSYTVRAHSLEGTLVTRQRKASGYRCSSSLYKSFTFFKGSKVQFKLNLLVKPQKSYRECDTPLEQNFTVVNAVDGSVRWLRVKNLPGRRLVPRQNTSVSK